VAISDNALVRLEGADQRACTVRVVMHVLEGSSAGETWSSFPVRADSCPVELPPTHLR
jgi:hypothetical protein